MITIENVDVYGFEHAIRGMRNPLNSWERSDSSWCDEQCNLSEHEHCERDWTMPLFYCIGENDLSLMRRLAKAGTEHRKFARMITVYMDITAPLYWWKEFDTYKVGTVANSCSTMHKVHAKKFTLDDFSHEHLLCDGFELQQLVTVLNIYRDKYLETRNKDLWWQLIQLLPASYNQRRTVLMNYEVCENIVRQRSNHKLDEWHELVDVIHRLPYFDDIFSAEEE